MSVRGGKSTFLLAALLLAAAAASGCSRDGDGAASGDDAGADVVDGREEADDSGEIEWWEGPTPPAPPEIPWLDDGQPAIAPPELTPCPPGWREATEEGSDLTTCDPWPTSGHADCTAADEAHFPGETGCARVGTACAADDDWAVDLPAGVPVLHVLAGATAGGDGSRAAPFATIAEALDAATEGSIVAVGKGTYDEHVGIGAGVTVWGACAADTVLTWSAFDTRPAVVSAGGPGAVLRNLRIAGGTHGGIQVATAAASLQARDVVVAGTREFGVSVSGDGSLSAEALVVRDTQSREPGSLGGMGLEASAPATVEIDRAVFERNRKTGVRVGGAGVLLTLTDVAVRETRSRDADEPDDWEGAGLLVSVGATVRVARSVFEDNRTLAIVVFDAGSTLTLEDVVARDTESREHDLALGRGMHVGLGAAVEVHRSLFERNRDCGISVFQTGTEATMTDVVVRDTESHDLENRFGRAIDVERGAAAHVTRGVFERNREISIFVGHSASLTLEDAVVRDTRHRQTPPNEGQGLHVVDRADVRVTRALFERNMGCAVFAASAGTNLAMEDVVLRDTRERMDDGLAGLGLWMIEGATATVTRALLERNTQYAVKASDAGTALTLLDVVVRDTRGRQDDLKDGRGLEAAAGARVDVTRALFERNREAAIMVGTPGTTITLTDTTVRETLERECAESGCPGRGAGDGLVAIGGGYLSAERFLVTGNAFCGVQIARGINLDTGEPFPESGEMDLFDGEISHNLFGVNVQTEDFDITRLLHDVLVRDNVDDWYSDALPVPGD